MPATQRKPVARIALVSADEALSLDPDMPPLVEALQSHGVEVATPSWDDASIDWARYDLALLRSTWDYAERIDEFLEWARRCASVTTLLNPPDVVAWNTDKHYLAMLGAAGVAVVPTRFVEPADDAHAAIDAFLSGAQGSLTVGERAEFDDFVVKPSIGAGSRDAARYRRADRVAATAHLQRLVTTERRSAMLQPYLASVDEAGETAVIYIGGVASHAIRKGPLLSVGSGLVDGLFAPEEITAREPSTGECLLAAAAYAAIPFSPPLYARIDIVHDGSGRPVLLELEMTEPSLFFNHAVGSADRLARTLLALHRQPATSG